MLPFLLAVSILLAQSPPPALQRVSLGGVDVPLARLLGIPEVGTTAGVSFLDYDADGWIDLFINYTGVLWRNTGASFVAVRDLDAFRPPTRDRYGAAAADFDNDGFPDIACEPRGDCLYLLRNLAGSGNFLEITADAELWLDPPGCGMFAETFCWADVDDDGDLDLWATAYPGEVSPGSEGNQFFENLGPSGPAGATRFRRATESSGLGNPENVSRPEGAQFADLDRDGDLDAYANGTTYQNVTAAQGARFRPLLRAATGILLAARLDEGVTLFDHDLDGDEDVFVLYKGFGNKLWSNRGDGTFVEALDVIQSPADGSTEGCSAEDWDLDGDLDLTTGHVFRRNLLVETGTAFFRRASHSIPDNHIEFPTPAWGDWDKDGDVDCMLANWRGRGRFYQNVLYGPETPSTDRLALRVRPLRDSESVPRGLETEFGAVVELRPHDDPSSFVRRRSVSSSHGYLQQSEYALTFALPPGPDPRAPASGVRFDLAVDFPSLESRGVVRIDGDVNPVLAGLLLTDLAEREVRVFRSGRVQFDGQDFAPRTDLGRQLSSSGALLLPAPGTPLPDPVPAPSQRSWVGLEFATGTRPVRLSELVLDGLLAAPTGERCDANLILFDVTPGDEPRCILAENRRPAASNHRQFLRLTRWLKPERVYRLACRVERLRATPAPSDLTAPGGLTLHGAFQTEQPTPCEEAPMLESVLLPQSRFLEVRYRVWTREEDEGSLR